MAEKTKSKFINLPGQSLIEIQPNSPIEELAIEMLELRGKLISKQTEIKQLEEEIGQKWEILQGAVLESQIKHEVNEEDFCRIHRAGRAIE